MKKRNAKRVLLVCLLAVSMLMAILTIQESEAALTVDPEKGGGLLKIIVQWGLPQGYESSRANLDIATKCEGKNCELNSRVWERVVQGAVRPPHRMFHIEEKPVDLNRDVLRFYKVSYGTSNVNTCAPKCIGNSWQMCDGTAIQGTCDPSCTVYCNSSSPGWWAECQERIGTKEILHGECYLAPLEKYCNIESDVYMYYRIHLKTGQNAQYPDGLQAITYLAEEDSPNLRINSKDFVKENTGAIDYAGVWENQEKLFEGTGPGINPDTGETQVLGGFLMESGHPYYFYLKGDAVLEYFGKIPKYLPITLSGPRENAIGDENVITLPFDAWITNARDFCYQLDLDKNLGFSWWNPFTQRFEESKTTCDFLSETDPIVPGGIYRVYGLEDKVWDPEKRAQESKKT